MLVAPLRLAAVLMFVLSALLAGCGQKREGVVTYGNQDSLDAKPAAPADEHGHAGHGHGGHAHKPLMGGELVEVGEHQFNLEFKFDAARGVLQTWVLDAHAENFVRVALPSFELVEAEGARRTIVLQAVANPISGETVGDTSSFEGAAPWLREIKHFDGVVKAITVRGASFHDLEVHFHP